MADSYGVHLNDLERSLDIGSYTYRIRVPAGTKPPSFFPDGKLSLRIKISPTSYTFYTMHHIVEESTETVDVFAGVVQDTQAREFEFGWYGDNAFILFGG